MGTAILAGWLMLNVGFAGGAAYVAYRKCGARILPGAFFAQTAVLMAGLSFVLYGLPLAARAFGISN